MKTVQPALGAVSTTSLTMEVAAVIHALRWIAPRGDGQITHVAILTDSMSLTGKLEWETKTLPASTKPRTSHH